MDETMKEDYNEESREFKRRKIEVDIQTNIAFLRAAHIICNNQDVLRQDMFLQSESTQKMIEEKTEQQEVMLRIGE